MHWGLEMTSSRVDKSGVSRRTVVRSAVWSVPVITTAVAMPLASASAPVDQQNVQVASSCWQANFGGVLLSYPQYTITAIGNPVKAGSSFLLTGAGIGNLVVGVVAGAGVLTLLSSTEVRFVLSQDIPAGQSAGLQVQGLHREQTSDAYILAVENIIGNANSNPADDASGQNLWGRYSELLGFIVGICG